jgi:hypothetical protein
MHRTSIGCVPPKNLAIQPFGLSRFAGAVMFHRQIQHLGYCHNPDGRRLASHKAAGIVATNRLEQKQ